jgi:hypothetical protein
VAHSAGNADGRLIVIRGNSASRKSSVAAEIRRRHGHGLAIVGQDNLRRQVLRERDVPGGANIGLIDLTARFALNHGFHVIVEGILDAGRYGPMLTALIADHAGRSSAYYLDVPWEETRAQARDQAAGGRVRRGRDARLVPAVGSPSGRHRARHRGGVVAR